MVVFNQFNLENIWNNGIKVATNGTIIARRMTLIKASFALSWKISNPYPAKEQMIKDNIVNTIEYLKELSIA